MVINSFISLMLNSTYILQWGVGMFKEHEFWIFFFHEDSLTDNKRREKPFENEPLWGLPYQRPRFLLPGTLRGPIYSMDIIFPISNVSGSNFPGPKFKN